MQTSTRVALNTAVQYIRMIVNVLIGLYSVRIILRALGAEDYGIYDVVAGVIGLLGFIQASLSQTSIRFISVSIGVNKLKDLKDVFNNCFWLHLFIAGSFSLLLLVVGLFLFDGFLNIPGERLYAAQCVYYCMVATLFLQIVSTPFQAMIVSYEQFIYVALISIMDAVLKLLVAFAILHYAGDKLTLYGLLMMTITLLNAVIYVLLCVAKHRESVSIGKVSFSGVKSVSSFAGWTLLDVFGTVITRQGYAIMLNRFFGPVINAAFALARQLEGQIYTVSASVIDTMKPQIMISHGGGDDSRMMRLSLTAGKMGFSMMSLVAIPLIVLMPELLALWLTNIPEGTITFARLLIIACMMEQQTRGLVYANQALGNIKWFSIIVSSCRLAALPISCVLIYGGYSAVTAIVTFVVCETIGSLSRVVIISKTSSFRVGDFVVNNILMILPALCGSVIAAYACFIYFDGWHKLLLTTVSAITVYVLLLYVCGLTKDEKIIVQSIVGRIFARK